MVEVDVWGAAVVEASQAVVAPGGVEGIWVPVAMDSDEDAVATGMVAAVVADIAGAGIVVVDTDTIKVGAGVGVGEGLAPREAAVVEQIAATGGHWPGETDNGVAGEGAEEVARTNVR